MGWSVASVVTAAMPTVATRRAATAAATPDGQVSIVQMWKKTKHEDLNCIYLFSSWLDKDADAVQIWQICGHLHGLCFSVYFHIAWQFCLLNIQFV